MMNLANTRIRRSVLYLPAANFRALEKARSLNCDGIIFDLEDAVAPDAKSLGRDQLVTALKRGGFGRRERIARVNAMDSEWCRADVAAVVKLDINAILFPKINSAVELQSAIELVDSLGGEDIPIWAMFETPLAILNAQTIVGQNPRLEVLVMGTADLSAELGVKDTPERAALQTALQHCVLVARANGRDILDGVHIEFKNMETFKQVCKQGSEWGFDGKTLIHPSQIEHANIAFAYSDLEVAEAHGLISAWENARLQGKGLAVYKGSLIETLHVQRAQRLLARHAEINP